MINQKVIYSCPACFGKNLSVYIPMRHAINQAGEGAIAEFEDYNYTSGAYLDHLDPRLESTCDDCDYFGDLGEFVSNLSGVTDVSMQ